MRTKPVYAYVPDEITVVHELSHMWFGDAVTVKEWPDLWLHEGFATFSEWIWSERHGGQTAQQAFDKRYADKQFPWSPPPNALQRPSQSGQDLDHFFQVWLSTPEKPTGW